MRFIAISLLLLGIVHDACSQSSNHTLGHGSRELFSIPNPFTEIEKAVVTGYNSFEETFDDFVETIDEEIIQPTGECLSDVGDCVEEIGEAILDHVLEPLYREAARLILDEIGPHLVQMSDIWEAVSINSPKEFTDFTKAVVDGDEARAGLMITPLLQKLMVSPLLEDALRAFKEDGAGSLLLTISGSGGYVAVGAGVDFGVAINLDYMLFPFLHPGSKTAGDVEKAMGNAPVLSLFTAGGLALGPQGGASTDFSIGYHVLDPSGVGGPGIDVGLQGTFKVGAGFGLGFDASVLADLRLPQLVTAAVTTSVGAKFELSVGGSYAHVLGALCLGGSVDGDTNASIIYGELLGQMPSIDAKEECPGLSSSDGGLYQTLEPSTLEESMECVEDYALKGRCNWNNWSAIARECNTFHSMDSARRTSLIDQVKAGQCTSSNWSNLRSEIEKLSSPLFSGLRCVESMARRGRCTAANWEMINGECSLYSRMDPARRSFLSNAVRDGQCTPDNWDTLKAQIVTYGFPLRNTLDCVGTYAKQNICDTNHWDDISDECGFFGDGASDILGDLVFEKVRNGQCTWNNWSAFYYDLVQENPEEGEHGTGKNPAGDSVECASGYTCFKDNDGMLWAKTDGTATGLDCDSVCLSAFAETSDIYTCKQGVRAMKGVSDLSALAAGMGFDCSKKTKKCWGMVSPTEGTILVTGDDNFSKNCYFPSTSELSCDVPIRNENCYGERFSSICPCAQEEEQSAVSNQWRLYTHKDYPKDGPKYAWNLDNIYFYESSDCTGTPIDTSTGSAMDSGNAGSFWNPGKAFDNRSGSKWGGRWDSSTEGNVWIGMVFPNNVSVSCVKFDQFSHNSAQIVKLQALSAGTNSWQTVKAVTDAHDGTNTIHV